KIKANALFYQGDEMEAVALYEDILQQNTTDYEVLTFLGAYYTSYDLMAINEIDSLYLCDTQPIDSVYQAQKQEIIDTRIARTLEILQTAQEMHPSEHLGNKIKQLSDITSQLPARHEKRKAKSKQKHAD
ncbi:MAG: hypothetical protein J6U43_02275, partial [Bacteroidales bacterium]|nr:hypothetical protein [Bacteroidales bacterium]